MYLCLIFSLKIYDGEKLLDILDDKNEVKEFKKLMPYINKCFYTEDFFTNSKDNVYNVDIMTIAKIYYVSLFF